MTTTLKQALDDCIISFDRRVLVTDLLEKHKLSYKEVHDTLAAHIAKMEKTGTKFEKRFLVRGIETPRAESSTEAPHEIYKVVLGESKMKTWLNKLQQAESTLYSVEIAGGAKAPAQIFKPMQHCAVMLEHVPERAITNRRAQAAKTKENGTTAKEAAVSEVKRISKPFEKQVKTEINKSPITNATEDVKSKKPSPDISTKIPTESAPNKPSPKATGVKPAAKKGSINSFFSAAKKDETKKESKTIKPPTPKKMDDFFKKPTETKTPQKTKTTKVNANQSMQLFDDDEEEADANGDPPETVSSDEEEKLDALRRKAFSSDHEMDMDDANDDDKPTTTTHAANKRRRIIDSDDEEDESTDQPKQKKQEKDADTETAAIEVKDNTDDDVDADDDVGGGAFKSETYLDDEGFVITIKTKKPNVIKKKKTSPPAKVETKKSKSPAAATKITSTRKPAATKTKQGNIMNFFTKK